MKKVIFFICFLYSRALVGAPRAQTSQPDVTKGGAVYKCLIEPPLDPPPTCTQVPFDTTGKYCLSDDDDDK